MEDSVADIELRRERQPALPIKNALILAVVSFGVTRDKFKAILITILFYILQEILKLFTKLL
jgi:hypothetical protein